MARGALRRLRCNVDVSEKVLTRKQGRTLFLAGAAFGLGLAAVCLWAALPPPPRRVRVLYFFPDGTTGESPASFIQEPATA